ncbi:MAG: PD40 domain-containing protein [Bacteroidales bacterium]|nr:PD40 domain-containing protein [Bacteroidales bacterium]
MKTIVLTAILITVFIAVNVHPSAAQSPEQLYQKGLMKEEGEGALQAAIDLFSKVADNSNADKSLQAKALLHIGMCYEKMGMQEAIKAYQRLVNNYPAQKIEVSFARERLSMLVQVTDKVSETPLIPKFTKIKIPTRLLPAVRLSPDGKTLAHVADKKLWITPLTGNVGPDFPGKPVQLNTGDVEVEWTGLAWSGDGKWIAFNDMGSKDKPEAEKLNQGIFVIPSGGGKPKKVIENYRDTRVVNYRISLSPDGKTLAHTSVENNEQHIYLTQVDGGLPKRLVEMQARGPSFSPDGKMIAFVQDKDLGRGEGELGLWIVAANGGTPLFLADAGKAASPVWSPDGSMIAFIDDTKKKQVNIVEVQDNRDVSGKVTTIDVPEGKGEIILLAGWTPDNKLGLLNISEREFSLFTLPAEGGQAAIVSSDCYAFQPRWSRDGKQIFYVKPPREGENRYDKMTVDAVPVAGGIGKSLPGEYFGEAVRQLPYQSGNRISPDGKMIVTAAYTSADTSGVGEWPNSKIWKISLDGKVAEQITSTQGLYADMCPSWSPDGKKVAFIRTSLKDGPELYDKSSIFSVSSSGGEPEMLIPETDKYINSAVWSPDGEMIAYLTREKEATEGAPRAKLMNVINVEDGTTRIVGEVPQANVNIELAWSPDSRRIAFNGDNVIKIMNVADGKTEDIKTGLVDVDIWHLDWSSDGKQFVFFGMKGGNAEFWFMENFLPLEKLVKKNEIEETPLSPKFTKIQTPVNLARGAQLSPDGKKLTFSSALYEGSIWTVPVPGKVSPDIAGKPEKLIGEDKVWAWGHTWSADGKWIAYNYMKNDKEKKIFVDEVYVIHSSGGEPIKIAVPENRGGSYHLFQYSLSLSPDGQVLAYASKEEEKSDKPKESYIYTISVKGGVASRLTDGRTWLPAFSPDGKKIAYIKNSEEEDGLWVIPSHGGTPVKVCDLGGRAWGPPVWSYNSDCIAFLREPKTDEECKEIWLVPVSETGTATAPPKRIELALESSMNLAGWTRDNKIGLLLLNPVHQAIYTIPSSGGKATQVTPAGGYAFCPGWNPDGKRIYFASNGNYSYVASEGGEISSISITGMDDVNFPYVSPDGKKVLFHGFKKGITGMHIWTAPIEGGEPTQVIRSPFKDDFIEDAFPHWSPDGKTICFYRHEKTPDGNGVKSSLCCVPAEGGDVKVLISDPDRLMKEINPRSMCWSLDGKSIVYYCNEDGKIKTIPLDNDESRVLAELQKGIQASWITFSPDGKKILYTADGKIWTKTLNSEEPVEIKTGLDIQTAGPLAWSPDGETIAFTIRKGGEIDLWMMEDFLPLEKLAKKE